MTPPLVTGPPGPCVCGCALTEATSYGFDVIKFARDVLRHPLDPWEELAVIHGGELLPDGRPRFRVLLILVARQNGKTELLVVLALFWQFVEAQELILGTSTKLDYAKESWSKSVKLARKCRALDALRDRKWTREANGEQVSWSKEVVDEETGEVITPEARYKIAPANEEGGRSLTINRLICDELRQHHDYSAWDAAEPATSAVWDAQIWGLSNAGDSRSKVLNDLRAAALAFIRTGEGDPRLGLLEWSAPKNASPTDLRALAMANPNLGRRKDPDALLAAARRAVATGGEALTGFKTEQMCIHVEQLDPAIDPVAWAKRCLVPGDLAAVRSRVACVLDVAPDGKHATLTAAAVVADGRVRVEPVKAWDDMRRMRRELPGQLARVKPQAFGWFPSGPAAAYAAELASRKRPGWPPRGVKVEEIKGDTPAVCMGFADLVEAGDVLHSGDPLLDAQVDGTERLWLGNRWVFSRRGGHCDAVYSAAGAVHLARTLPAPVGKPRLIVAP